MHVELIQGEAVVAVDLLPGEHSLGGGAADALRFEGLAPGLVRLRVDEKRICVSATSPLQIDGVMVPPDVWRMLIEGETLELGLRCFLRLAPEDTATDRPAPATGMVFRDLLHTGTPDVRGMPALTWLTGPEMGRSALLSEGARVLGRGSDADLRIRDRTASRRHARLIASGGGYVLEDLGSPNGVFVNGESVQGAQALESGDVIELGRTLLRLYLPPAAPLLLPPEAGEVPAVAQDEAVATEPELAPLPPAATSARRGQIAGPGEWILIGAGTGLTLMGALMSFGLLP